MKTLILGSGPLYQAINGLKNPYSDILNQGALASLVREEQVAQIWFLPDTQNDRDAWTQNTEGLCNVLEVAAAQHLDRVFFLSSLQESHIEPTTIFGISKRAGEHWCEHYRQEFGLDVCSLRMPQLLSEKSSTFINEMITSETCHLKEDTCLPFIYINDAVNAIQTLMNSELIGTYNACGFTIAPCDLAAVLAKPVSYQPDYRQAKAQLWPSHPAQNWNWQAKYNLSKVLDELLVTS